MLGVVSVIVNLQLSIDEEQLQETVFVNTGRNPSASYLEDLLYQMVSFYQDYGVYLESVEIHDEENFH
jgi:hypothetical protein